MVLIISLLISILNIDISILKRLSSISLIKWTESYSWWLSVLCSISILCSWFLYKISSSKFAIQKYVSAGSTCFNVSALVVFFNNSAFFFYFHIIVEEILSSPTKWIMNHLYDSTSLSFPKDASFWQTIWKFFNWSR